MEVFSAGAANANANANTNMSVRSISLKRREMERATQDEIARSSIALQHPPHVFVIDWDGTIAGNVEYQSQYFGIISMLRRHRIKPNVTNIIPHAFSPKAKLIRPGFASWMKAMKQLYGEAYFFIYTASEKKWAHQEVAWVEKLHEIKFDRPIFTRGDCTVESGGNLRKSLTKVFPRMMTYISKKRGQALTAEQRMTILKNYTMVIDNNAVYLDHTDKLLLCPDYGYSVFENLLNVIPKESRGNPSVQQLIYSLSNSGYLCNVGLHGDSNSNAQHMHQQHDKNTDGMYELMKQYSWLADKCKTICRSNDAYIADDFWKYLKKVIVSNKIQVFTPSIIRQLQDAAFKRSRKKL
jgi:hypothetical protein